MLASNARYLAVVVRAMLVGVGAGLALAAWFAFLAITQRTWVLDVRGHAINVQTAAALYVLGGFAAGTIVGLLFPLFRSRIGSAFVGFLAAIPMAAGYAVARYGSLSGWSLKEIAFILVAAAALGPPLAIAYREMFWHDQARREQRLE